MKKNKIFFLLAILLSALLAFAVFALFYPGTLGKSAITLVMEPDYFSVQGPHLIFSQIMTFFGPTGIAIILIVLSLLLIPLLLWGLWLGAGEGARDKYTIAGLVLCTLSIVVAGAFWYVRHEQAKCDSTDCFQNPI